MKKSLLLIAAVAFAGNFMFTSCSDDDNKGSKNNTPNLPESDLAEFSDGFQSTENDGNPESFMENVYNELGDMGLSVHTPNAADFGSDGNGMLHLFKDVVSADGEDVCFDIDDTKLKLDASLVGPRKVEEKDPVSFEELWAEAKHTLPYEYIKFKYTYDQNTKTFTIPNFASFQFFGDKIVNMKFLKNNSTIPISGTKFGTVIDRTSDNSKYLCRSWKINKIRLEAKKNGKSVVAGEVFNTTNLLDIATQIQNKHDISISAEDRATLKDLGSLRFFTFSHNGRVTFFFTKKVYTGTWKFENAKNGTISYKFDKSTMKNAFIEGSGKAKVKFDASTNELDLTGNYTNKSDNAKYVFNSIFDLSPVKTIAK